VDTDVPSAVEVFTTLRYINLYLLTHLLHFHRHTTAPISALGSTFRRHLKTHYFQLAYPAMQLASMHQRALILFVQTLALYKSFTCLLTYLNTPLLMLGSGYAPENWQVDADGRRRGPTAVKRCPL